MVAVTPGSLVIVAVAMGTSATPSTSVASVTDSAGQTWTRAGGANPAGTKTSAELWYVANSQAITSVTVNLSASCANCGHLHEVSGTSTGSPLDQVATNSGTSGTTVSTGTTGTTSVGSEFVAAILNDGASGATWSAQTTGYTNETSQVAHPTGMTANEQYGWQIVSSTGAQSYAATASSSSTWAGVIATFEAAPAASGSGGPANQWANVGGNSGIAGAC
jgi:hypothetical protein